jgi:DNA-binding XRE family transcriptional regulator
MKKTFSCVQCDNDKPFSGELLKEYKYEVSGLENVVIKNGVYFAKCPKCKNSYTQFVRIQEVNHLLFNLLLKKDGLLNVNEIKFIRKHLGYGSEEFARIIGYSREAYSRIENGKDKTNLRSDRTIRFAALSKPDPDRNYDIHDAINTNSLDRFKKIVVDFKSGEPILKAA